MTQHRGWAWPRMVSPPFGVNARTNFDINAATRIAEVRHETYWRSGKDVNGRRPDCLHHMLTLKRTLWYLPQLTRPQFLPVP